MIMPNNAIQKSDANPGWRGRGIPTLRTLLLRRSRQIITQVKASPSEAKHLLQATAADLWTFYLNPRQRAQCPCCGWRGAGFLSTANWRAVAFQSRCPECDSRSRHRGQTKYLQAHSTEMAGRKALVFAPEKIILTALNSVGIKDITTMDFNSVDVDLPNEDIQSLSLESASFQSVVCNHVLEHVLDDQAGISECARVLEPGGVALFTIPGDFNQQGTWCFERPDSNGHYRHYGLDVLEKFRIYFPTAVAIDMSLLALPAEHVRQYDMLFVCRKPYV